MGRKKATVDVVSNLKYHDDRVFFDRMQSHLGRDVVFAARDGKGGAVVVCPTQTTAAEILKQWGFSEVELEDAFAPLYDVIFLSPRLYEYGVFSSMLRSRVGTIPESIQPHETLGYFLRPEFRGLVDVDELHYCLFNGREHLFCLDNSGMPNEAKQDLDIETLHDLAKHTVIKASSDFIPGAKEEDKKEWCVKRLSQLLETFDNTIPVVGVFLDNPIVDDLEEQGVRLVVEWAWDKYTTRDDDFLPPNPPPMESPW